MLGIESEWSEDRHSALSLEHYNAPPEDSSDECEKTGYQRIVGGLLIIALMTRPEISIHVNLLGRREYAYSVGTGLIIQKPTNLQLTAYADASYGEPETRSQEGALMTLFRRSTDQIVEQKTRRSITVDNRGRIYRRL